jgi:hypothetical protein
VAYLDSLSHSIPPQDHALLGATSNYLESLSHHMDAWSAVDTTSHSVWTAEMLQQATDDLTRALHDMTRNNDDDTASAFVWDSTHVLADNAKYLWDVEMVDPKGRMVESMSAAKVPPIFQKTSSDAFADISHRLNDLVRQFTTETTKMAQSAANAARDIHAPMNPNYNHSPPWIPNNDPLEPAMHAASSVSTQLPNNILPDAAAAAAAAAAAWQGLATASGAAGSSPPGSGRTTAVQFASAQGFSEDISGVGELILATLCSLPRAIMDQALHDYAPTAMQDLRNEFQQGFVIPLTRPLQEFASQEPWQQLQSILKVLQLLLAVMVAVPRTILESLTGVTASEYLAGVEQLDISDVAKAFLSFAGAVIAAVATLLKFVLSIASSVLGVAAAGATTPEDVGSSDEIMSSTATFLAHDLLPTVMDGFVLLMQHIVEMMSQDGSMAMPGL